MEILEEREERLRVLCNEIATLDINQNSYGIYCSMGGNLPDAGGGFLWFNRYEDFLELARYLAYFYVNPPDADTNHAIWEDINPIVDQLQAGNITLEEARIEMNDLLEDILVEVDWWGSPNDLRQSDAPFAQDIREQFWASQDEEDEEENTSPIEMDMLDQFITWLQEYV